MEKGVIVEFVVEPEQSYLNLWPNPTSGSLTLEMKSATNIEVMDIQGRCVAKYALEAGTHHIDLGDLSEGVYFIQEGNGTATKVVLTK